MGGTPSTGGATLIAMGAVWKYWDQGTEPADWKSPTFDDSAWKMGPGKLGYEDGAATPISFGADPLTKHMAYYFRHTFQVADPAAYPSLLLRLVRDDGAIIYVNGMEVHRDNMADGPVDATTPAILFQNAPDETMVFETPLMAVPLVAGKNVIAVEVHQHSADSSDLGFDLELKTP